MLVNNFGYILLHLFLLILKITLVTVAIVAKILHLPTVYAILSAWIYPSKFATKTRLACRFLSHNVTPLGAFAGFFSLGVSQDQIEDLYVTLTIFLVTTNRCWRHFGAQWSRA